MICAKIEEEVAELEEEEKQAFLEEMGIEVSGLDILIQKAYHLLGVSDLLYSGWARSARVDIPSRSWKLRNVRESSTQTSNVDLSVPKL